MCVNYITLKILTQKWDRLEELMNLINGRLTYLHLYDPADYLDGQIRFK